MCRQCDVFVLQAFLFYQSTVQLVIADSHLPLGLEEFGWNLGEASVKAHLPARFGPCTSKDWWGGHRRICWVTFETWSTSSSVMDFEPPGGPRIPRSSDLRR